MGSRMELVAGDAGEIMVAIGAEESEALRDPDRFRAYLSLSGGMDPTWLDFFSEACRSATDRDAPVDFIDARTELGGDQESTAEIPGARTVERVDPTWVAAVAAIPDVTIDGLAGRWIDRIQEDLGQLASEEKPWVRELAGDLVRFCRTAAGAPDVVFVWSL